MTVAVILLAAGKGTRMNSKYQKILHEVGGKPMVQHVFETAVAISDIKPTMVVSYDEKGVQKLLGDRAVYVEQIEKLGTGHATMVAKPSVESQTSQVIVMYGDMPLLRPETLKVLIRKQVETNAALSMLTVMGTAESSFGRVVRDESGGAVEIVEVAEAKRRPNPAQWLNVLELNVGVYCFNADFLWQNIDKLPQRKARNGVEYYLTDMIETAVQQNKRVEVVTIEDADECLGAGTRTELIDVERAFRKRTNLYWLNNGVTLVDPATVYIDQGVTIGQDTIIWPNTFLQGKTIIGEDCVIGPNAIVRDTTVADGCIIEQAKVIDKVVKNGKFTS